jgi:hypothetical protein
MIKYIVKSRTNKFSKIKKISLKIKIHYKIYKVKNY